jgi:hypothetical protein
VAEPGEEFAAPIVVAATAISACVFAGRLAHVIAIASAQQNGYGRRSAVGVPGRAQLAHLAVVRHPARHRENPAQV